MISNLKCPKCEDATISMPKTGTPVICEECHAKISLNTYRMIFENILFGFFILISLNIVAYFFKINSDSTSLVKVIFVLIFFVSFIVFHFIARKRWLLF